MRTSTPPECWHCGSGTTATRLDVETMIHTRSQADGGPYRSFRCSGCGATNGALRNRAGAWLLYPLEGADEPSLIDWISPRFSRRSLRAAVEWWARNRSRVIRFRQAAGRPRDAAGARAGGGAPPGRRTPPRRPRSKRSGPAHGGPRARQRARTPPPPPTEEPAPSAPPPPAASRPPPSARSPRDLLGVDAAASVEEVKKAYRRALKLCHPDRVANLDPEIQDLAHRKAKALRRAYESLLRDLGG